MPDEEADIAILEEPEHLNWYHHGRRWTSKFKHVVGVCHTNYLDYARREENGRAKAMILSAINKWVCRSHCHKVIKLSGAVQRMPREVTEFVHGVSPAFLEVGDRKARQAASAASPSAPSPADVGTTPGGDPAPSVFSRGAYFIGKAVWAKGYTELLERLAEHKARTGQSVHMDVYGSGEDLEDIKAEGHRRGLELTYWGAKDHLDKAIHDYKVFVNPSTSDVVATTTAEALAMGKIVVVQDLPCNQFFSTFENCLVYRTPEEFSEKIQLALSLEPKVREQPPLLPLLPSSPLIPSPPHFPFPLLPSISPAPPPASPAAHDCRGEVPPDVGGGHRTLPQGRGNRRLRPQQSSREISRLGPPEGSQRPQRRRAPPQSLRGRRLDPEGTA